MQKITKISMKAAPVLVIKTDDGKFLLVGPEGETRIETEGREVLRAIKSMYEIDAYIS